MALPSDREQREYNKFEEDASGDTAVRTTSSSVATDDSAAPTNPDVVLVGGKYTASDPTLTDGDASVLHVNQQGNLKSFITNTTIEKTSGSAAGNLNLQVGGKYQAGTPDSVDDNDNVVNLMDIQGRLVIALKARTATVTSVNDTNASTTLLASNDARLGATIFNDSTAILYLKLGATASTSSFTVKMAQDDYYEVPSGYTGIIDGIWSADASGAARITEIT